MKRVYVISLVVLITGLMISCEKQKDTVIEITVLDGSGSGVEGATVNLYGEPSDSVYANKLIQYDLEETTDENGLAIFVLTDFYDQGSNGFAVLSIFAEKDSLTGTGKVKLVEEEVSEKTVYVD